MRRSNTPRNAREKEIIKILCGIIMYDGDGSIRAAQSLLRQSFHGFFSAFAVTGIFGLSEIRHQYRVSPGGDDSAQALASALSRFGKTVVLDSAPDAQAVLCSPFFFPPSVITLESKGKNHLICFYTSKSFFSRLNYRRELAVLSRRLAPYTLSETRITIKPQIIEAENTDEKAEPAGESVDTGDAQ